VLEHFLPATEETKLFGGNARYERDKYFSLYHSLPRLLRSAVIEPLIGLFAVERWKAEPSGQVRPPEQTFRIRGAFFPTDFFLNSLPEEMFENEFLREIGSKDWLSIPEEHFHRARATSELNRLLYLDIKMTLADNDIRKVTGTAETGRCQRALPAAR